MLQYSRQLLELIQATLDVSRMESGALPVTLGPVDVAALLGEVEAEIPAAWVKPGVQVSFATRPDDPAAAERPPEAQDGDPQPGPQRAQVHRRRDGGCACARSTRERDALVIAVADTGIGISPEGQGIIFDMFRQVDGSDRRRHDGVGLGLYIVRRLTSLLGGTISVESEVGRGSRFEIRFPLRPCGARVRVAPRSRSSPPDAVQRERDARRAASSHRRRARRAR